MDSFKKDTHRYAFGLVKAAREMAVDIAEKLPHLTEITKLQMAAPPGP